MKISSLTISMLRKTQVAVQADLQSVNVRRQQRGEAVRESPTHGQYAIDEGPIEVPDRFAMKAQGVEDTLGWASTSRIQPRTSSGAVGPGAKSARSERDDSARCSSAVRQPACDM